ncbi:outer membrane lipoprotein carrier protein LolA [Mucilaginibacter sp. SMC90]|uniref:LolA family protein n=1 Tax=Mucilaginibacter sp. SMC90 TaxID=2929803 RepID=UPI001FB46D43|nr:outer membrane lipoprotein carrier protein LolA [Mucilaginibacter sp. SMC90]UOE49274.1 outer membrane lipoprotein carrier protein LolA [Mucilaginibacter sp. SMC90]
MRKAIFNEDNITKVEAGAVRFPPLGGCREGFHQRFTPTSSFPKEGTAPACAHSNWVKAICLFVAFLSFGLTAHAQHAGYTQLSDLTKFKQQFAEVAAKTNSIKSDFTQEKSLSMLSEKITSKGKFWYRKPNMLRMEYTQPFSYLMILNKDNVYIKDGQKENKVSTRSNKVFKQINKIVVDCIQGTALNSGDFKSAVYENKGTYLVSLSPVNKQLSDFFKTIEITVDKKDYSVNTIEMLEGSGDSTTLHFTNKEINATIPDALFAIK